MPGVTGTQGAAQALAESQDSNVPAIVSNRFAVPAFAESQVSGAEAIRLQRRP